MSYLESARNGGNKNITYKFDAKKVAQYGGTIDTVRERFRQMYAKNATTFYNAYPNLFNNMRHPDGDLIENKDRFLEAVIENNFSKQLIFIVEQ